jgi:hypothetical protein
LVDCVPEPQPSNGAGETDQQVASDADCTNPVLFAVGIPEIEEAGQRDNSQLAESRGFKVCEVMRCAGVKLDQEVECGQVTCMDVCSETQRNPARSTVL